MEHMGEGKAYTQGFGDSTCALLGQSWIPWDVYGHGCVTTSHESLSRVTLPDDPVRRLLDNSDWGRRSTRVICTDADTDPQVFRSETR